MYKNLPVFQSRDVKDEQAINPFCQIFMPLTFYYEIYTLIGLQYICNLFIDLSSYQASIMKL